MTDKVPSMPNPASVVQRMLPRHFQILEMIKAGHTHKTISETFNMHRDTISALARSPCFQAELVRRRKEDPDSDMLELDRKAILGKARSILEQSVDAAATKQVELLETNDPALQLRASERILDRVFGKSDEKIASPVISLSAENVQLLVLAMKESDDAQATEQPTNGEAARSAQDGQAHVRETSEGGPLD